MSGLAIAKQVISDILSGTQDGFNTEGSAWDDIPEKERGTGTPL